MKRMHLFFAVLLIALAGLVAIQAADLDPQRIQRLEDAVRQLQDQNEALKKRIQELEHPTSNTTGNKKPGIEAGGSSAGVKNAQGNVPQSKLAPLVVPWGKESKLALGGFLQVNGELGDVAAFEGRLSGGANRVDDRFRLRRARINVTGDFLENLDFKLEGDFQQSDGIAGGRSGFSGTDLWMNLHAFPEANLKAGQFKAPFGLEQITPDTRLFTVERALVSGALTPERQVGFQLWGKPLSTVYPDEADRLSYALGVFNGNGRNTVVNDNGDFMQVARVEALPYSGKLWGREARWRLGANGLYSRDAANVTLSPAGNLSLQSDGSLLPFATHSPDERAAWGVDEWLTIGPFDVIAEYIQETIRPITPPANFRAFTADGYYVQAGWFFWKNKLQLVGKWESFNPGQSAGDDIDSATGGLNYYIRGDHIKLMLDHVHTWSAFRRRNPGLGRDEFDVALVRLQLMF